MVVFLVLQSIYSISTFAAGGSTTNATGLNFFYAPSLHAQVSQFLRLVGTIDPDNVILATKAGKPYVVGGQSFQFVNYTTPACGATPSALFFPPGTPETQIQNWA